MPRSVPFLLVLALLAAGLGLRLTAIGRPLASYQGVIADDYDEIIYNEVVLLMLAGDTVQLGPLQVSRRLLPTSLHPPLWFQGQWLALECLGASEASIRAYPCLMGLAAIVFAVLLGAELAPFGVWVLGPGVALTAYFTHFSHTALFDSPLLAGYLAFVWGWHLRLRTGRGLGVMAVAAAFMLLTKLTAVFLLPLAVALYVYERGPATVLRSRGFRWLAWTGLAAAGALGIAVLAGLPLSRIPGASGVAMHARANLTGMLSWTTLVRVPVAWSWFPWHYTRLLGWGYFVAGAAALVLAWRGRGMQLFPHAATLGLLMLMFGGQGGGVVYARWASFGAVSILAAGAVGLNRWFGLRGRMGIAVVVLVLLAAEGLYLNLEHLALERRLMASPRVLALHELRQRFVDLDLEGGLEGTWVAVNDPQPHFYLGHPHFGDPDRFDPGHTADVRYLPALADGVLEQNPPRYAVLDGPGDAAAEERPEVRARLEFILRNYRRTGTFPSAVAAARVEFSLWEREPR